MFDINILVKQYYIHTKLSNNLHIAIKRYVIQDSTLFINLYFHNFRRKLHFGNSSILLRILIVFIRQSEAIEYYVRYCVDIANSCCCSNGLDWHFYRFVH